MANQRTEPQVLKKTKSLFTNLNKIIANFYLTAQNINLNLSERKLKFPKCLLMKSRNRTAVVFKAI